MMLSKFNLKNIQTAAVEVPAASLLELPEKVLQFGTGVLLRGLPDYFIDKANKKGFFNGRVVIVKSTDRGGTDAFGKQDGLYTICVRGIQEGEKLEENHINTAISRVLSAAGDWNEILRCAHNPELQIIVSNTTEVGIQLIHEDITRHPPQSFPGKLLAFLLERYSAFGGSAESGMLIIPTELIVDNARKLESIVLELAHLNGLDDAFIHWIENSNRFCSSLVDRIVPGKPDKAMQDSIEEELGYHDDLLIMCEVYRLWAIEGDEKVREKLSFAAADEGVVIAPDINLFRELKLRMLNGTHTLSCGLAFLAGYETVHDAMEDEKMAHFISRLMLEEIGPSIPYAVDPQRANTFGNQVLDRFRNPFIRHEWINITMQYSSKIKMRCVPLLLNYYKNNQSVPAHMALGFAAYLLFTRPLKKSGSLYYGIRNEMDYIINDDYAPYFYTKWQSLSVRQLVDEVLSDSELWGTDLSALPGFADQIFQIINRLAEGEAPQLLLNLQKGQLSQ